MSFLDRLERRLGWVSFPGFLRYYALFHLLVYALQIINSDIGKVLEFDRARILSGEVWRVVTFLFASSGNRGITLIGALFFFFMVRIAMMMSDSLEEAWGVFKTTMFFYFGAAMLVLANFVMPVAMAGSGFIIYGSAFFAFATLYPRLELLLLVIPVQIRFLAFIQLAFLILMVAGAPMTLPFALLGYSNYLIWSGIPAWRGRAVVMESAKRRKRFKSAQEADDAAFHRCNVCRRTEITHPGLEFRVGDDGEEYCADHLPGAERAGG
jgi:hypothetical protein